MDKFIIGQLISILVLILAIAIVQFKDIRKILPGEITINLLAALSYFFLGGWSGAWICVVASIQTIVLFRESQKEQRKSKRRVLLMIFAGAYVAGTLAVYQSWKDIICCICALLYTMAVMQKKASGYRLFIAANSILWIIYDIKTAAYGNMITHGMVWLSTVGAMMRIDYRKEH